MTTNTITGTLNKKEEKMINRICEMQDNIKDIKAEMDILKDKVDLPAAKYTTKLGHTLNVVDVQIYQDIDPCVLKKALVKAKIAKRWVECVKVNLTMLKKVLPGNTVDDMRIEKCVQVRSTYK